ncbi:MAG: enoyl-CoA hydratase-related protein [Bdellovibrio sp.]
MDAKQDVAFTIIQQKWQEFEMKTLSFSCDAGLGVLRIERPEVLNALSLEVLEDLSSVLEEIRTLGPDRLRVLLLTGAGEKAFVAGADIKQIQALKNVQEAREFSEKGQRVFRELELLPFPVVAVVNGFALGGGLELALACDFILASEKSRFGLPEVGLGLLPGFGGTVRLARSIGLNRARAWTFMGEMVGASEAMAAGLVSALFPEAELKLGAQKIAAKIASKGPRALALAKQSILQGFDLEIDEALSLEAKKFGELIETRDAREGLAAFLEKRPAQFQGI